MINNHRAKTVLGVFHNREHAEAAISELNSQGFDAQDISIIMKDTEEGKEMASDTGANVAGGAVTGATTGAVVGGIAGLLTGIGAIAIPGFGGILIGGPLAAALGLTGAAATTISGAATGALAGGVIGALAGLGLQKEEAKEYEEHIREGAILLAVPTREEDKVRDIFAQHNASRVRSVVQPEDMVHKRTFSEPLYQDAQYRERFHGSMPSGIKGGRTSQKITKNKRKK